MKNINPLGLFDDHFLADSAYTGEKPAIKKSPGHENGSNIYLAL